VVPGSVVQLENPDTSLADLKVFRIDPAPSLPLLRIRSTTPPNNTNVTFIALGALRGAATSWMGIDGWLWADTDYLVRWGTNRVYGTGNIGTLSFITNYTQGGTTHEAQGAVGDSGGAAFIKQGGNWELAGVLLVIGTFAGQPAATALYGNTTYAADLSQYRSQLIALTRPQCADEVDNDGDLAVDWPSDPQCSSELDDTELPDADLDDVGDPLDNCLVEPNEDQRDTDLDGYGNVCDADYDNNGVAGASDFAAFKLAYGSLLGGPLYDPDLDADGDGAIGSGDFVFLKSVYGGAPGPSGLACAGSPPCPPP
jgi:hypothetical protein